VGSYVCWSTGQHRAYCVLHYGVGSVLCGLEQKYNEEAGNRAHLSNFMEQKGAGSGSEPCCLNLAKDGMLAQWH
jgi:hypothetical protein